jgi:hypothetical protein
MLYLHCKVLCSKKCRSLWNSELIGKHLPRSLKLAYPDETAEIMEDHAMAEVSEATKKQILANAREVLTKGNTDGQEFRTLSQRLHTLAEDQYPPAYEFFVGCLERIDRRWRHLGVTCLGFHYTIEDTNVLERMRYLILNDPDSDVRLSLSNILESYPDIHSGWPDHALLQSLQGDPVVEVRMQSLESLLLQAKVPINKIQEIMNLIRVGTLDASVATLRRIAEDEHLPITF